MATTTPNYGWTVPTSTDYVKDGATASETLGDAIDASVYNKIYSASRQLQANNNFNNVTVYTDLPEASDKTALDLSVVKKQASSLLVVHMYMPFYFTSGSAQNVYCGINIAGTDYGIGGTYVQNAVANGTLSGVRVISGLGAGTYAVKPRFSGGGASAFVLPLNTYVSYSVQELAQ
jgi:hypothetical protein